MSSSPVLQPPFLISRCFRLITSIQLASCVRTNHHPWSSIRCERVLILLRISASSLATKEVQRKRLTDQKSTRSTCFLKIYCSRSLILDTKHAKYCPNIIGSMDTALFVCIDNPRNQLSEGRGDCQHQQPEEPQAPSRPPVVEVEDSHHHLVRRKNTIDGR